MLIIGNRRDGFVAQCQRCDRRSNQFINRVHLRIGMAAHGWLWQGPTVLCPRCLSNLTSPPPPPPPIGG